MPETTAPETTTSTPDAPTSDDPRYAYAIVTSATREMIDGVTSDQLGDPTPCTEFAVRDLLDHLVMVQRRVAALGRGESWASVEPMPVDSGWGDQFGTASHDVMLAWTDAAKLDEMYEVPWAVLPGRVVLMTYVAELAVHAWDLATATGQTLTIDDDVLRPALEGFRFAVPADGRAEMPFGAPCDAGPDASVLEQLAAWLGRDVVALGSAGR